MVRPSGRIRGSAREGRARVAAIEPLVEDLTRSAAATLTAAGAHTEGVLRAALTGPDAPAGGASVDAAWESPTLRTGRRSAAEQAARALDRPGTARGAGCADGRTGETSPDGIARPRRDVRARLVGGRRPRTRWATKVWRPSQGGARARTGLAARLAAASGVVEA